LETVFSLENETCVCLYTKVIGLRTKIVISLHGINTYKSGNTSIKPLSLLVAEKYWKTGKFNFENPSTFIVDPIFDTENLDDEILKIIDQIETGGVNAEKHEALSTLYDEAPGVLAALVNGVFYKSPFTEIRTFHPFDVPQEDKWFLQTTSVFKRDVRSGNIHFNQQEFDSLSHRLVVLRPSKISISLSIAHAIDGLIDLGIIRHFYDPYSTVFGSIGVTFESIRHELQDILVRSVFTYCQIYDIDYRIFANDSEHKSLICIDKNIHDEVTIEFYDHLTHRHVIFYSYYPLMCLGTWGVGETLR
jgi:hypothetical protein